MTPLQILEMLNASERLDFSQTFGVGATTSISNTLFPRRKTQYAEAEYFRLVQNGNIPVAANVHALDTEAYIGNRDDVEAFRVEPWFIKEKINQGENLRRSLRRAGNVPEPVRYIFDDMARLSERVVTRAEVMGFELLATGTVTVNENNINQTMDFGVPTNHTNLTWDWSGLTDTYNPWADIRAAARLAEADGGVVNAMMMGRDLYDLLLAHPITQAMANSTLGLGLLVSDDQLRAIARSYAGIEHIYVNEEKYRVYNGTVHAGDEKATVLRKFPANVVSLFYASNTGAAGVGLWGVTPEEERYQGFENYTGAGFVTITQWSTEDPIAVWTKASGMYIPVIPTIQDSLIISTVTVPVTP